MNVDCSDQYVCVKTCAIHLCHAHLQDVFPCACVHAMDMLWIDHHCVFTCLRTCNLHVSILVPIHLCVSLTRAVAIYLSGVYLCQLTSAEIVAFIFRFVGKGAYAPVVHVDPRRLAG
jgi:hypothetical protein